MDKVEYINSAQHTYIQQTLSKHKHSPSFLQMQYASMCHYLTGQPLSSNTNAGYHRVSPILSSFCLPLAFWFVCILLVFGSFFRSGVVLQSVFFFGMHASPCVDESTWLCCIYSLLIWIVSPFLHLGDWKSSTRLNAKSISSNGNKKRGEKKDKKLRSMHFHDANAMYI